MNNLFPADLGFWHVRRFVISCTHRREDSRACQRLIPSTISLRTLDRRLLDLICRRRAQKLAMPVLSYVILYSTYMNER
jgi:hypothetical protein